MARRRRSRAMAYLAREPERRFDPRRLDARFRSVVSLGYPYAARATPEVDWRGELRGRIAAYALGRDYHDVVRKQARAVADVIAQLRPGSITRSYVDTGPVFEREWAAEARLGWFGKNTMILNREHGSYFFLAEIFTDVEFEPTRGAVSRALRHLPAMPRSVPDRRARRRLRDALGSVHLVSDHRKSRRDSARAAAEARQLDFRLRHLQGSLPVERQSAGDDDARTTACRVCPSCWRSTTRHSAAASRSARSSAPSGAGCCATSRSRSATRAIPTRCRRSRARSKPSPSR